MLICCDNLVTKSKKEPHLVKKKVIFCQYNAPTHKYEIAMAKIHEFAFELVPHLPFTRDF